MKKILLFALLILSFFGGLKAQGGSGRGLVDRSNESLNYFTISLGPEYCYADTKQSPFSQSLLKNWDLSFGYRKIYANNWGYKAGIGYADYSGADGPTSNRVFSFTSGVMQISLQAEYNIKIGRRYYYKPTPNAIYFFLGAGVLRSNANLKGDLSLRSFTYKPIDICAYVPLGFGYHYDFNNGILVGAEMNFKYPLADYIDGFGPKLSQGSKYNDFMGGFSLTFSYLLESQYLKRH
jgi:hypothetical protein